MICNICGINDATIHLTEINNHQMVEIHLCETCAQEKGTEFKTHFNVNDLLTGLAEPTVWSSIGIKPAHPVKCPECGMTYEELSKKGRLGCSDCYTVFEKVLIPLIRRVQRSVQHTGKRPSRLPKSSRESNDLAILQQRLRKSVQEEAFEEAAKLRDEIRKMEEKNTKKNKPGPRRNSK